MMRDPLEVSRNSRLTKVQNTFHMHNDSGHSQEGSSTGSNNGQSATSASLEKMFEGSFSGSSSNLDDSSGDRSRTGGGSSSKRRSSKVKSRSGGGELAKERKPANDMLGSFLDKYVPKNEEDDGMRSRGGYSTMSKMRKSKSKSRSSSSRSVAGQRISESDGKDRRSKKSSSRESSSPSKSKDRLGSFLDINTPTDKGDIETRSAYSSASRIRKKRGDHHSISRRHEEPSTKSKDELMTLFRQVSKPSDFLMTDKIRGGAVADSPKARSNALDMDHIYTNGDRSRSKPDANTVRDHSVDMLLKIADARDGTTKIRHEKHSRRGSAVDTLLKNSTGTRRRRSKSRPKSSSEKSSPPSPSKSRSRNSRSSKSKHTSESGSRRRSDESGGAASDERRSRRRPDEDSRRKSASGSEEHRRSSGSSRGSSPSSQRPKSSRRLVSKEDCPSTPHRQKSSRRLVSKDSPSTPHRQKSSRRVTSKGEASPRRSKHSSSRGSDSPNSSAAMETPKSGNRQKPPRPMVLDSPTPILEDEEETPPVHYFEQDIFSVYTWSDSQQDKDIIQKERKTLRDSIRDSPLFRAFPHQRLVTV